MTAANDLDLLNRLLVARTTMQVEAIISSLPVQSLDKYQWDYRDKRIGTWLAGHLQWVPVGRDRGNGGRIKLAGEPTNPIAERLVNGMEAIVELARLEELQKDPDAKAPASPRDAALRYFGLPRLDSLDRLDHAERSSAQERVVEIRKRLFVRLDHDNSTKQFAVTVRDRGMGQVPSLMHETLLSLGQTDKAEKPYLIGVFGQGGSSAYSASEYSVILTRRAAAIRQPGEDAGVGWTIVRQVVPANRRDPYYAYLAEGPEGEVPRIDAIVADAAGFDQGSHFAHVKYDFGGSAAAISHLLYQALNHVLFNPILPYDLFALKDKPEQMLGTAYRLARQVKGADPRVALNKSFRTQPVV
ncbi:hypothetical protein NKJ87_09450 [Mesorhizobium sp. M0027]|uniref:hypothetical protein n=1 Tax=Mesorhizobium sp. M0027 TaxID=2956848 RepID=UPI00333B5AF3